jgi:hypothetical protein
MLPTARPQQKGHNIHTYIIKPKASQKYGDPGAQTSPADPQRNVCAPKVKWEAFLPLITMLVNTDQIHHLNLMVDDMQLVLRFLNFPIL